MEAYLDNAATTRVSDRAAAAALAAMTETYGNPSSSHGLGRSAKSILDESRKAVAKAIGALPKEISFTSGGTEGDNWALLSGAALQRRRGNHIISSLAEHDAVLKSLEELENRGFAVSRLRPDELTAEGVENALRDDTVLVSLMTVNNETGALTDIGTISKVLKKHRPEALLHTDAVQALLKIPLDARMLGADLITLSAHKVHGPKGVGALYIRQGVRLPPLIYGGGQEDGRRSGTEAVPLIAAFAAALTEGLETMDESVKHMTALRERAVSRLLAENPGLLINGGGSPHILNLSLPGYRSEVLRNYLDARGVYVSTGSACKKGARSHVLEAMGLPAKVIDGALRISISRYTTPDEIEYLCDMLKQARENLVTAY